MRALEVRDLTKSFGAVDVLRGISFSAGVGEFICLLGPSGCGKSTLLRCIAGLEKIDTGSILIGGEDKTAVPPAERDLAMVFQSYALYPHLNVRKNMAFGLSLQGMKRREIDIRVAEAARILDISALLDRKPRQLSGGQRQRVAIGRAIVRNPTVFLFDEPLSNLDAALRTQTRYELAKLHKDLGRTMLFVTHDQIEAMTLSTTVVVLNMGRVEQIGAPLDLYNRPANRFVAGFIGSPQMNFLPATLRQDANSVLVELAGQTLPLPLSLQNEQQVAEAGLRPEHLRIAAADEPGLAAQVTAIERLGAETLVFAKTAAGQALVLRAEGGFVIENGQDVSLTFDPASLHFFDENGARVNLAST